MKTSWELLQARSQQHVSHKPTSMVVPTSSGSTGDLALEVLQALSKAEQISSAEIFAHIPFDSMKAAVDRLFARSMITYEQVEHEEAFLEPEAEDIIRNGSHEARVFEAVRQAMSGLSIQELEESVGDKDVTKLGQGRAFRQKWIRKDGNKIVASVSISPSLSIS